MHRQTSRTLQHKSCVKYCQHFRRGLNTVCTLHESGMPTDMLTAQAALPDHMHISIKSGKNTPSRVTRTACTSLVSLGNKARLQHCRATCTFLVSLETMPSRITGTACTSLVSLGHNSKAIYMHVSSKCGKRFQAATRTACSL